MKNIVCKHCGKEFNPIRKDAKYCSNTCRTLSWQKNKAETNKVENFQKTLKGVLNDKETSLKKTIKVSVPNPEYSNLKTQLNVKQDELKRLNNRISELNSEIQRLMQSKKGFITILGTTVGAIYGASIPNKEKNADFNPELNVIGYGIIGLLGGGLLELATQKPVNPEVLQKVERINVNLKDIAQQHTLLSKEINSLNLMISNTKPYITTEKEVVEKPIIKKIDSETKKAIPNEFLAKINVNKEKMVPKITDNNVNENSKIISSSELALRDYQTLAFDKRWKFFFGFPSINFHCAIHGMAGGGKSNFAIQFSKYLSENFGKVLYISGEEGFSKTIKDKFVNNKADSEDLSLADLRNYTDIINEVKPNIYNFIFIDSLDNMRIGAGEMKELRQIFIHSGIITISQSTKDGKMRGSYEIVHDSDISVSVTKGIAETTKNRFLETGRTYEIFPKDDGVGLALRNTVKG